MSENNEDNPDDPTVTMTQSKLNALMADARRARPKAEPAITPQSIAEIVAQTVAQTMGALAPAAAAPETPRPPVAAMPHAPTGPVNPTTSGGLIDLFSLTPNQLQQLGPQRVRKALEQIWSVGNEALPKRPNPTGKR